MEVSARRSATLPNRTLCRRAAASSTDGRRQSRSGVSGALLVLWTRKSTAAFDQDLDSAGCSYACRVPSSGAVVAVQRVRRRLQMSRLDSTR